MFDIVNPCGIMVRFDHLWKLSPLFAAAAEKLMEPLPNDSRTTPLAPLLIKTGDRIATAVGLPGNVAVDWGVYDLRQKNEASHNPAWSTLHHGEMISYAVCWLNLLPSADSTTAKSLPGGDSANGKQSDYCG